MSSKAPPLSADIPPRYVMSDERLSQLADGTATAFEYEAAVMATELMLLRSRLRYAKEIMECNDPTNARELFGQREVTE